MKTNINTNINHGDIFYAELPTIVNSHIQQGSRPVLIISNAPNNKFSPTINYIPITSKMTKSKLPIHVQLSGFGLKRESLVLCEQFGTLDKVRLKEKVGSISNETMQEVKKAMMIQLEIEYQAS